MPALWLGRIAVGVLSFGAGATYATSKEIGKSIGAALPYIAAGVAIYAYVKAKK